MAELALRHMVDCKKGASFHVVEFTSLGEVISSLILADSSTVIICYQSTSKDRISKQDLQS